MIPRLHEVLGTALPGTTGVAPRQPAAVPFRHMLEQMLAPKSGGTTSPSRSSPRSVIRSHPVRQPAPVFRFRVPHAAGSGARGARPGQLGTSHAGTSKHEVAAAVRHAAATAGVAPGLSVAVARAESSLNPAARSPDGRSVGTFQVLAGTAAEMERKFAAGTVERPEGTDDVATGVGYLRYLHDIFGREARLGRGLATVPVGDPAERQLFAVAAFNAGEGRVAQAQARATAAGGDPTRFADIQGYLPSITRGYVARVAGYAIEESGPEPTGIRA
ncbi:MAG: transglycosylase SLT domain-containing protein [Candidatus Binatia bacterium]